jgi:hypothetical protein
MGDFRTFIVTLIFIAALMGCTADNNGSKVNESQDTQPALWWEMVPPISINGDQFYGKPCSVTQVTTDEAGVKAETVIFTVPSRAFTSCAQRVPNKNYLKLDGKYIVLHVDRQTFGAGSWTGERYRSADFISWEQYIGITWLDSEEYEAWRKVGSTSSKADSIQKVAKDSN